MVELLVVVGIVGVLAAVLLPMLARARQAGRNVVCQTNLRQVGLLLQMYATANKGSLPYASVATDSSGALIASGRKLDLNGIDSALASWNAPAGDGNGNSGNGNGNGNSGSGGGNGNGNNGNGRGNGGPSGNKSFSSVPGTDVSTWVAQLQRVTPPSDSTTHDEPAVVAVPTAAGRTVNVPNGTQLTTCPNALDDSPALYPASYSAHPLLMPNYGDRDTSRAGSPLMRPYRLTKVRRSSDVIMTMEASQVEANQWLALPTARNVDDGGVLPPTGYYNSNSPDNSDPVAASPNVDPDAAAAAAASGNLRYRHFGNKSGNFLFADGHTSSLRPDEVKKLNVRVDP